MSGTAMQLQHSSTRRTTRFAWVLPLTVLFLCGILLWPMRVWIASTIGIHLPAWLVWPTILDFPRWLAPASSLFDFVAALNLPAGAIQLPYVIFFSPDKREWMPAEMDFRLWRALTWPLLCIPFWWMASRGIDALIALKQGQLLPKISWLESILGAVMAVLFAVAFVGLLIVSYGDKDQTGRHFIAGLGLWAMLGSLSVIAKFRQWRLHKNQKLATTTENSPPTSP